MKNTIHTFLLTPDYKIKTNDINNDDVIFGRFILSTKCTDKEAANLVGLLQSVVDLVVVNEK